MDAKTGGSMQHIWGRGAQTKRGEGTLELVQERFEKHEDQVCATFPTPKVSLKYTTKNLYQFIKLYEFHTSLVKLYKF